MARYPRLRAPFVLVTAALALVTLAAYSLAKPDRTHDAVRLGAFVSSVDQSPSGRIAALRSFERRLGRRLSIVQSYHPWSDPFPTAFDEYVVHSGSTLLLSWAGTDTARILAGDDDAMIRARAEALARLRRPVLLRWRWEMNRPNLAAQIGSAEEYVAAWRHLRAIFTAAGADNVSWVWCPLARDFSATAPAYFPGDDQVDWVCVDAYTSDPAESLSTQLDPVLRWAASHPQPLMIGEFGTQPGTTGQRAAWLGNVEDYVRRHPRIRAVLYFDADVPTGRFALDSETDAWQAFRAWAHRASAG